LSRDAEAVIRQLKPSPDRRPALFIDCGSNVGQGISYFLDFFPPSHFDYVLVEPNPHCAAVLRTSVLPMLPSSQARIIEAAAAARDGEARLYGLVEDERGETSQGASIFSQHNSAFYRADEGAALVVKSFSFSHFLNESAAAYDTIAVKMDIEGAEYEVLESMLKDGTAELVSILCVEFHSRYMREPERTRYERLERQLLAELASRGGKVHLWK